MVRRWLQAYLVGADTDSNADTDEDGDTDMTSTPTLSPSVSPSTLSLPALSHLLCLPYTPCPHHLLLLIYTTLFSNKKLLSPQQNISKPSFDLGTYGLWAHHATTAPL